jgi:hypothetical protein
MCVRKDEYTHITCWICAVADWLAFKLSARVGALDARSQSLTRHWLFPVRVKVSCPLWNVQNGSLFPARRYCSLSRSEQEVCGKICAADRLREHEQQFVMYERKTNALTSIESYTHSLYALAQSASVAAEHSSFLLRQQMCSFLYTYTRIRIFVERCSRVTRNLFFWTLEARARAHGETCSLCVVVVFFTARESELWRSCIFFSC